MTASKLHFMCLLSAGFFSLMSTPVMGEMDPATEPTDTITTSDRAVIQTDEAIGIAFAREVDLNPMLVGFVKAGLFHAVNQERDSKMTQTIFVPSPRHLKSNAFQKLLSEKETQPLIDFLRCHVMYGKTTDESFRDGGSALVWMRDGDRHRRVKIGMDEHDRLTANGFAVLKTIESPNGVIHVIDGMFDASRPAD